MSLPLSLSVSLLYAYISTRHTKENVMIERLLAPTPPGQLTELVTEPPEVKNKKQEIFLEIYLINYLVNTIIIS